MSVALVGIELSPVERSASAAVTISEPCGTVVPLT